MIKYAHPTIKSENPMDFPGHCIVKILADSISKYGARITTWEIEYARFFHSEFMTHKMLEKCAASSRAIPTAKLLNIVRTQPIEPLHIGANQGGMVANQELGAEESSLFLDAWRDLARMVAGRVEYLQGLGGHKQIVNRPLEAFLPIKVVCTGTDFDNYFFLRDSEFAQPEFKAMAHEMRLLYESSTPTLLNDGQWHLPYIYQADMDWMVLDNGLSVTSDEAQDLLRWMSVARSGRVTHALGGLSPKTREEEIEKGKDMFRDHHMSPFGHVATPWDVVTKYRDEVKNGNDSALAELLHHLSTPNSQCPAFADVKNLRGWRSMRSFVEHGEILL